MRFENIGMGSMFVNTVLQPNIQIAIHGAGFVFRNNTVYRKRIGNRPGYFQYGQLPGAVQGPDYIYRY
jgi:hypothetical protein